MKTKSTLLFIMLGLFFKMNSQVLVDNFIDPWSPATLGWAILNNSQPVGTTSLIAPGNPAVFPSYNGAANDYVAMNWQNTSTLSSGGGISTWLMTPTISISNGVVLQFATRTASNTFADRLQIRMSPVNSTVIPTGTTSVGTYTNLLLDINPNLSLNTTSVVSNGSVNGYPMVWTVYTIAVTGVTGTVTGRFAFRYFVDNGGGGANSNYIGIDAVKVSIPCNVSINDYSICTNGSATLNTIGGVNGNTYTWSPNASNNNSIIVTPSVTTVYTLNYIENGLICPVKTVTVTVGNQLSALVSAGTTSVCPGKSTSLTVISTANSYTWNTGSNNQVLNILPTATTVYSVAVSNGTCTGTGSITIYIAPVPSPSITLGKAFFCPNSTISITGSGANAYLWELTTSLFTSSTVANPTSFSTDSNDVNVTFTLVLTGINSFGCLGTTTVFPYIEPNTYISIASKSVECINNPITLTASGAATYTWTGAASGTTNPLIFNAPSALGSLNVTAIGTSSAGCKGTKKKTILISDCVGIDKQQLVQNELKIYPNPFNTAATIEFGSTLTNAEINIYNLVGQKVRTVQNISGDKVLIEKGNLPTGIYYFDLMEKGKNISSGKLVVKD